MAFNWRVKAVTFDLPVAGNLELRMSLFHSLRMAGCQYQFHSPMILNDLSSIVWWIVFVTKTSSITQFALAKPLYARKGWRETPRLFTPGCEEVYSYRSQMDVELKKLLQDLSSSLKQIAQREPVSCAPRVSDTSNSTGDLAGVKEAIKWHKIIGSGAITAIIFLFGWFFLQHPHETKEDAQKQREQFVSDMNAAIQKAISPVNERLAVLTTTIELTKPDAGKRLPATMRQNLHGDAALGLETVRALAVQAREKRIETDPSGLASVIRAIQRASPPIELKEASWNATTALLDYRSFLNHPPASLKDIGALPAIGQNAQGLTQFGDDRYFYFISDRLGRGYTGLRYMIDKESIGLRIEDLFPRVDAWRKFGQQVPPGSGAVIEPITIPFAVFKTHPRPLDNGEYIAVTAHPHTTICLDYLRFRDVIFINSRVSYEGRGQVSLENVLFINCTFQIQPSDNATQFAEAVGNVGPTNYKS